MGVTGLWRLIEPAGKPVPVETLENKVLAVDISIWLHQMVKGYQDAKGAPLPNAHLVGLFQRVCKLLYFRVKPVFVFDGAFPDLKKETINKRRDNKLKYNSESERIRRELTLLLSKKTAISSLLGKQISPKKNSNAGQNDDIFKLPALPQRDDSEPESEEEEENSSGSVIDLHSVDVESENFKSLPVKEKYDLLIELKDTRKMNSWGKLHELPKKSDNFSDFQMQRLLKRRKVQECLQETEKEMGDCGMSLNDLESFLNEEGIDTKIEALPTRRIAANNTTRYVLINDVKKALADAKKKEEAQASTTKIQEVDDNKTTGKENAKRDELEEDLEKAIKMSLECDDANISACTSKTDDSWNTYDTDYSSDSEEEDGCDPPDMTSAKAYIMQYSDLTNRAIDEIVTKRNKVKYKNKKPKINEIMEEIRKEQLVILDNVDLSSSDDDNVINSKDAETKNKTPINTAIELNTSTDLESQNEENVDATQASVIYVGNPTEDIVTLDSGSEDSIRHSRNSSPQPTNKEDSDSSDNDFEDVPEVIETKNKTVVQLTLNVNDAPEDDIFADVFITNKLQSVDVQSNVSAISKPKLDSIDLAENDDDEELRRAIKMSLEEDIESENSNGEEVKNIAQSKTDIINSKQDVLKEKNNEPVAVQVPVALKVSKTQESLDVIQSAVQTTTENNITDIETDKPAEKPNPIENAIQPLTSVSKEILNDMVEEIQNEEQDLIQEKGRLDRVGRNITEQMTKEAQELLRLFGIPYIVAPMEAEAQCAFLESVKLTDGTITDDSDIWLFGGKTVYKNFFNQKKHVLQFLYERIEKSFNLNREQLILLALLVGSDYTTGLDGVGPVTALEILASFPFNKRKLLNEKSKQKQYAEIIAGLNEFKQWARSGKRTDNTSLKKKLRNVTVTDDFPSVRVVQAYMEPNIEKSEEKFTWGEIDITILRDYTKAKFGWSQHKLDEIIKPVLKRMVERQTQKTLHDYFKKKANIDSVEQMSKRVKAAVQKMGPEQSIEELTTSEDVTAKPGTKRKVKNKRESKAGPSKSKQSKTEAEVLKSNIVKVITDSNKAESSKDIVIPKTDRYQEIIPQREKDKQSLLENKMKAIELFRKTQIDKKKKITKKKRILPKPEAELSESSDSN